MGICPILIMGAGLSNAYLQSTNITTEFLKLNSFFKKSFCLVRDVRKRTVDNAQNEFVSPFKLR